MVMLGLGWSLAVSTARVVYISIDFGSAAKCVSGTCAQVLPLR